MKNIIPGGANIVTLASSCRDCNVISSLRAVEAGLERRALVADHFYAGSTLSGLMRNLNGPESVEKQIRRMVLMLGACTLDRSSVELLVSASREGGLLKGKLAGVLLNPGNEGCVNLEDQGVFDIGAPLHIMGSGEGFSITDPVVQYWFSRVILLIDK